MLAIDRRVRSGALLASLHLLPGCGTDASTRLEATSATAPSAAPTTAPTPGTHGQMQWVRHWCGDGGECAAWKLVPGPGSDRLVMGVDHVPGAIPDSLMAACYSAAGERRWTAWFDRSVQPYEAVAIDDGWIVVGSVHSDTPGASVTFGSLGFTLSGSADGFIARLSHEGEFVWVRRLGDDSVDLPCHGDLCPDGWRASEWVGGVARAADGTLLLTGSLHGDADLLGQPVHSAGKNDAFVARVSGGGDLLAYQLLGGPDDDGLGPLVPAPDGSWVTTRSPGGHLSRLSADGTSLSSSTTPVDLFALAPDGDVVTVRYELSLGLIHVARLDPSWNTRWTRPFGEDPQADPDLLSSIDVSAIAVDASGNTVLATSFCRLPAPRPCKVRFGDVVFTDQHGSDLALLELDPAGNQRWARQIEVPWVTSPWAIELRPDAIFLGGSYSGGFDWEGEHLPGEYGTHGFLARLAR